MARPKKLIPDYRKHRGSGQAVVTIAGRDHYLGPHGTQVSKNEYDRLIGEWLQNGRQLPGSPESDSTITVAEMVLAYLNHAEAYYRKNGQPTSEVVDVKLSMRPLLELYSRHLVSDFGPIALKAVRQRMVEGGLSRGVTNQRIGRIKRAFKWAVSCELIPETIARALESVDGLKQGRTEARETSPILPVDDKAVDATLPHLPEVVADMVRLQRATGMRPGEVCAIRPCDIDRSGDVWTYTPASHKTQHHGRTRTIAIGPKGQAVLLKYLARDPAMHCFRPVDSEAKRLAELEANRKTPPSCGNRRGTNRKAKPKTVPGKFYTHRSYARAIYRACDRAFPAPKGTAGDDLKAWQKSHRWAPNRLRHSAATEIRQRFGLEAAQVTLGHASAQVTQVYAERDLSKAVEVARAIG